MFGAGAFAFETRVVHWTPACSQGSRALIGITLGTIDQKRLGGAIDWRPALLILAAQVNCTPSSLLGSLGWMGKVQPKQLCASAI